MQSGGSILMWKHWYGRSLRYVGVDVDPRCSRFAKPSDGLHVAIGSQLNRTFLLDLCAQVGDLPPSPTISLCACIVTS